MAMIELQLAPDLRAAAPRMAVRVVTAAVTVRPHDEELWREIEVVVEQAGQRTMDDVRAEPEIKALRDTYRALGQDPTRYRGSSEALVRRIGAASSPAGRPTGPPQHPPSNAGKRSA